MGIKGLWHALREYVDDGHLSQFRGQRVAIDMYVWLHRCVHRCVRINTEAVLAYLEAKYSGASSNQPCLLEPSAPPPLVKKERFDSATGVPTNALTPAHAHDLPLPSIDDVLVLDDQFITLVLDKVTALQRFGVTPVCVFDGDEMPMKGTTDEERQRRRHDAFAEAMLRLEQLYCDERRRWTTAGSDGTHQMEERSQQRRSRVTLPHSSRLYEEAVQLLEKAVDISTELAHAVIQVLKEERNVECIVAPYEADAQLAYLCREGYVAAAASEDSDLIAYYCPCVISKLDTFSGKCEVLQPAVCAPQFFRAVAATAPTTTSGSLHTSSFTAPLAGGRGGLHASGGHTRMRAAAAQPLPHSPPSPFGVSVEGSAEDPCRGAAASAFTYESFLLGCIMAGCDYVTNLRNIGIKKAFRLVAHATSLRQVFTILETEYGFPAEELARYRRRLLEAFYCFAHHLVYCPLRQEIVTFHSLPAPPPSSVGGNANALLKTQLVGERWAKEIAQDVCARCLCDPCTLRLYRGTYQSCVTRYLQRTRRGQTSLKAYAGFEELSSNKVVVHLSGGRQALTGVKRERGEEERGDDLRGFESPLKKKHVASGFLGAVGADGGHARPGEVVVVRSRYFMMRGRTAVCEPWSASEEGDDEEKELVLDGDGSLNDAGAKRAGACPSDAQDAVSLHASAPRLLGLSRPSSHVASPPVSVPSASATKMRRASSTAEAKEDLMSGAEAAATTATLKMGSNCTQMREDAKVQPRRSREPLVGREKRAVATASMLDGSSGSRSSAASLAVADPAGNACHSDEASCGSDESGGVEKKHEDNLAASREVGQTVPCLTGTPDVEPYTYPIGGDARADAAPTGELKADASVRQCACPFGYWQCNRAHSVFESCFLGKQWNRDDDPSSPPPPTAISLAPLSARASPTSVRTTAATSRPLCLDPTGASHELTPAFPGSGGVAAKNSPQGYIPRAFRPPRSTAFPAASADSFLPTGVSTDSTVADACTSSSTSPVLPVFADGCLTSLEPSEESATVLQAREGNQEGVGDAEVEPRNAPKSSAASPPVSSLPPSRRAAARRAIFDTMAFKKTS
ncbi:hypothetical protein ABB37_02052 [Leptomonas pyrrhocoris]|uniref:Uncharacterized protein n=1 Tax=Leptomonas pyrrhocoris TaxID=157538 RepID=A0A0M9G742_LEPPY|nr:hypothetical protein ABB37_02052 [Leptomonas pyrrhocoris]XP_015662295.1 hypothetical protein ABB37_02052 [Leptomonas pyrrhocoris]XP_015662296.1 hypothetical protein ABB37_02052 [Leptomonas pyrrhocoris]KPA83855.1 hypothetical protein ABB37_02052 [Leptomonas pyrrhocoris]KPA83856.1 hypothetical protein ABB37_02052 [Leptomonas pyrrhocoris]KPA83857.1 hypothetical protein ABB37_02052 [Leptomonas pyrrhocoris]|eukprot:XP_015662294.1 hypothetical protein ABB37_02052 [Leptomonas pyrrhocoris]